MSKHLSVGVRASLQEFNQNNATWTGAQLVNNGIGSTLVTASPLTEPFDGRVVSVFNEGNVTWQINARLSINLSGAGFLTRRATSALYGDTGYQSGADISYRLNRRTTMGAYYSYTHFDYIGIYGGSDINTAGVAYSVAFNTHTQLAARVGGSRLETTGLQQIKLDPFLAILFGGVQTIQAVYYRNYAPDFNVELRHNVQNLSFSLGYARGITPGNGVILTSQRESISAGVNYAFRHKWNIAGQAGYDRLSGTGPTTQSYSDDYAGISAYRTIARHLDWHTGVTYRHYYFENTGFRRNELMISTGVAWSPGNTLERLW
jgi:hypothetical protein